MTSVGIGIAIESATARGEIALIEGDKLIANVKLAGNHSHGKEIATAMKGLLASNNLTFDDVEFVCVDAGPGSYTGIRVGLSYAKAIAMATGASIAAACSLKAMARRFFEKNKSAKSVTTIIDAKWNEIYVARYDRQLAELSAPSIIRKDTFATVPSEPVAYNPESLSTTAGDSACLLFPSAYAIGIIARIDRLPPNPVYIRTTAPQLNLNP